MNQNNPPIPEPPGRPLGERGRALWDEILERFELYPWETVVLVEACRCLDLLERLAETDAPDTQTNRHGEAVAAAHVVEARQQQATALRLLASLRLPEDLDAFNAGGGTRPQRRGAARGSYGKRNLRSIG